MAKKKDQKVIAAQADAAQVQAVLDQYHQIAKDLHTSHNQQEAESALTPINELAEASQMALLKTLSKEKSIDAADVLLAVNELSPTKSARKEARRSLIRLEEARIYPQWTPPVDRTPAIDRMIAAEIDTLDETARFWKGYVTDSRAVGEVQLLLLWEQGDGYRDVRVLGFLLEFWHDGVKDFFSRVESKRRFERFFEQMQEEVDLVDCSLAKGRSLIEEALAVNQRVGTKPHRDFTLHRAVVDQLVLENPDIAELEEDEEDFESDDTSIDPNLEPGEVVTNFIEAWVDEEYELAYNYLSADSSLREGLTEEEWAERREQWLDITLPDNLVIDFERERESQKPRIWLPNPFSQGKSANQKEIELGWSIELLDTEWAEADPTQATPLPELPQATTVYEVTGRHWFWTSYILVKEENGWRIQSMTDEGTNARGLSIAELQKRINDNNDGVMKITQEHSPTDPDAGIYFNEIMWRSMQNLAYADILLTKLPLDQSIYMNAAVGAITFGNLERGLVYLEQAAERFSEQRAENLRQIAAIQLQLSERYAEEKSPVEDLGEEEDDEEEEEGVVEADTAVEADTVVETGEEESEKGEAGLGERFRSLAEAAARQALALENNAVGHIILAQALLQGEDDRLDEAEEELHAAQELSPTQMEEASIEASLGDIYMLKNENEQALSHFRRTLEIQPDFPNAWYNLGRAYKVSGHIEEAIHAFRQTIILHPETIEAYLELANIYIESGEIDEARSVIEEGMEANPGEVQLISLLALTYIDSDPRRAEELLEEAESIDPDEMMVMLLRQIINVRKLEERQAAKNRPKKRR